MYCNNCAKGMAEADALGIDGWLCCPKCHVILVDAGEEEGVVSPQEKIAKYDEKNKGKKSSFEGRGVIYTDPQIEKDILDCKDTLKYQPDNIEALMHLGKLYKTVHDYQAAKPVFEAIIELAPHDNQAYQNIADIYMQLHDYGKVGDVLEKMLENDPKNETILSNLEYVRSLL
jgi:tetratricopeptide (TPR) repeat protein